MTDVQLHTLPVDEGRNGERIAYRYAAGSAPCIVFLPGYMSDMDGGKATAILADAKARGQACLLLDYSGCGQSDGDFADGTLSKWRDEVLSLISAKVDGPVLLMGSSMGGWLMLMVGQALGAQLSGVIGIASAPDFTDWGRSETDKAAFAKGETVYDDNPYGPEPTPMYAGFYTDGEANKQLSTPISITCPVRLIHGQRDDDVPWQISLQLAETLRSDNVQVTLVKDGDHRLSRDADIALLLKAVAQMSSIQG